MLETIIFSLSNNVFYCIKEKTNTIRAPFKLLSPNALNLDQSRTKLFSKFDAESIKLISCSSSEKMDENRDIYYVLDKLAIKHLYPEKLTRQDLNVISEVYGYGRDLPTPKSSKDFFTLFLHKLKLCHPFTRNIQVPKTSFSPYTARLRKSKTTVQEQHQAKTESTDIHPLDIQVAIFLCCDDLAKQDFVSLFWKCKFGIPFVVQLDQLEPVNMYSKPLAYLTYTGISNGFAIENRLQSVPLKCVCFIRYGDITKSKSKILNKVLCQSEKEHSVFFHRDNRASTKCRSTAVGGLIEMMCGHVPKLGHCMFFNLRGDVAKYPLHLTVMLKITNVFVIVCTVEKMEKSSTILQKLTRQHTKPHVLYLLTDLADHDTPDKEARVMNFAEEVEKTTVAIEMIALKDSPENDVTGTLVSILSQSHPCIRTIIDIERDVKNVLIPNAELFDDLTNKTLFLMNNFSCERSEILPLSGRPFTEWSKANKEIHKLKNRPIDVEIETYRSMMENKKNKHRKEQVEMLKSKSLLSAKFVDIYQKMAETERGLFLRMLGQLLDDKNRDKTWQAQKNISDMISSQKASDLLTSIGAVQKQDYLQLEEDIDRHFVTVSDLIFEIGQLYEAHSEKSSLKNLPEIAVNMVLKGYPLPLMDRNSLTVPIVWINAVFKMLNQALIEKEGKSVKIMVVSVLGIQSTGKSSLLNTMFGSRFAVGSGRCTRGIYMHVVRVQGNENVEYLFVVDTEGLCAIEDYANPAKERELATFVLGLADVTLLNIMGENTHYLRDILPVAVHAFLRMDLIGLHPKCLVVHQNVDRLHKHILERQWDSLETTLDEYTQAACDVEKVPHKRFRDIVEMNITKDIYPFSGFVTSVGSVDTVSEGYSESCMELLKDIVANCRETPTVLDEFREYLKLLWTAVNKENFVYDFKNTAEAGAKSKVDHHTCLLLWEFRKNAREKLVVMETVLQNAISLDVCEENTAKNERMFKLYMDVRHSELKNNLKEFFKKAHPIFQEHYSHLKKDVVTRFDMKCKEIVEDKLNELRAIAENKKRKLQLRVRIESKDLKDFTIKSLEENEDISAQGILALWMHQFEDFIRTDIRIEMELHSAVTFFEAFPSHRTIVEQRLQEKQLAYDTESFQIKDYHFIPTFHNSIVKDQKEKTLTLVQNISTNVNERLSKRKEERRKFDPEVFLEVVLILKKHIDLSKESLATNVEFEIDLTQWFLEHTKTMLVQIEEEVVSNQKSEEHASAEQYLLRIQEVLEELNGLRDNYADEVLDSLIQGILEHFSENVVTQISDLLLQCKVDGTSILSSKYTFLLYILFKLLKENKRSLFKGYTLNPLSIMRACLCDIFDDLCLHGNDSEKVKSTVISCILHIYTAAAQRIDNIDQNIFKTERWLECVHKNLEDVFPVLPIRHGKVLPVRKDKVMQKMKEAKAELGQKALNVFFDRSYDDIKQKTVELVLNRLSGCTETCPKCGEICLYENENHNGAHKALMHKPLILVGNNSQLTCQQFYGIKSPELTGWDISSEELSYDSYWQLCAVLYSSSDASSLPDRWKEWNRDVELDKLFGLIRDCLELD